MLTVRITDRYLEKSISEKARLVGKSTQELVEDLLRNALHEKQEGLSYQKLNPESFGYIISADAECESVDEDVSLFSDIDNAAEYTENLRKKGWRKQ